MNVFPHHTATANAAAQEIQRKGEIADRALRCLDRQIGLLRDALHRLRIDRVNIVNDRAELTIELARLQSPPIKASQLCPQCGGVLSPYSPGMVECPRDGCPAEGVPIPEHALDVARFEDDGNHVTGPAANVPPFPSNDDEAEILADWQLEADSKR